MKFLAILGLALLVGSADAHGTLTKPVARNRGPLDQKGPSDFQSGNGGGKGFSANYNNGQGSSPCGDGIWGFSNIQGGGGIGWHYRGGDAASAPLHTSFKALLSEYNPDLPEDYRQTYTVGQQIEVQAEITAYHGGDMTFHLCPVKSGELDFDVDDCGVLAAPGSAEFEKHKLKALTATTLPRPSQFCTNCAVDEGPHGWCGYNPGCEGNGPDGFAVFDITLEPAAEAMDHGVIVWHWTTNNNGDSGANSEQFMNCADVTIAGSSGPTVPTPAPPQPNPTSAPESTAAPTAMPTDQPTEAPITASPTSAPTDPTSAPTDPTSAPTSSPSGDCAQAWQPCGGKNNPSAPTCCTAGNRCDTQSEWYHQCVPDNSFAEVKRRRKPSLRRTHKQALESSDFTGFFQGSLVPILAEDEMEDEDEEEPLAFEAGYSAEL